MSLVENGAQRASRDPDPIPTQPTEPVPAPHRRTWSVRPRRGLAALLVAVIATTLTVTATPPTPARAASDYLLMPRSELLGLPTTGTAWSELKSVADSSLGSPDLCDQNSEHHLRTLAAALVFARTGSASYGAKARQGVMAALPTQNVGCGNAVLSLGRQLPAYVMAADLAGLSGTDDATFRSWLTNIRAKDIGGHSTWYSLTGTHRASANNWGAFAGAARIAASLYLGDTNDVANAARVTRGFLGDRSAYTGFSMTLDSDDLSWSCSGSQSTYTPENAACSKGGVNLDGAIVADISRGGPRQWPPQESGISYQLEAIQGVGLQVELLYRNGYPDAWDWSASALRRAAQLVQRSHDDGGDGWNSTNASSQAPWLLNKRYGSFLPTRHTAMGRAMGFADWLWGSKAIANLPAPKAMAPVVKLSTTSTVPSSGVPVVVIWGLASTSDGLSRYDLQVQKNGGSWTGAKLASRTATSYRKTLASTATYAFRVRAVDRSGRIGAWVSVGAHSGWRVSDGATYLDWSGTWGMSTSSKYLDGKLHRSTTKGSAVTFAFSGSSIGWVSPVGPTLGQAAVFVDGTYQATVNLYAKSYGSRRVAFAKSFSDGRHSIRVRVAGTNGHPTVGVDGFYVVHR